MYWKKIFGESLYNKVKQYAQEMNISITTIVRLATEKYIREATK